MNIDNIPQFLVKACYIYIKPEGIYTIGVDGWSKPQDHLTDAHISSLVLLYNRSEEIYDLKKFYKLEQLKTINTIKKPFFQNLKEKIYGKIK